MTHLRRNVTNGEDALTGRDRPFSSMVQEECSSFWAGLGLYCTIWARPSDGSGSSHEIGLRLGSRDFFYFLFSFFTKIYFFSKFTKIYPCRPAAGRQGFFCKSFRGKFVLKPLEDQPPDSGAAGPPGRPAAGRQATRAPLGISSVCTQAIAIQTYLTLLKKSFFVIRRVVSRQRRGLLRRLYTVVCYACPER